MNDFINLTVPPSLILIDGYIGSDFNTLITNILDKYDLCDIRVTKLTNDNFDDWFEQILTTTSPTLFSINAADLDESYQNKLLKVFEEQPAMSYILIYNDGSASIINTVINRSYRIVLNKLSKVELSELTDRKDLIEFCENKAQLDIASNYDINNLKNICLSFWNNMENIRIEKCFELSKQINFSNSEELCPLWLFMRIFKYTLNMCNSKLKYNYLYILNEFETNVKRINKKQAYFELYLLNIIEFTNSTKSNLQ